MDKRNRDKFKSSKDCIGRLVIARQGTRRLLHSMYKFFSAATTCLPSLIMIEYVFVAADKKLCHWWDIESGLHHTVFWSSNWNEGNQVWSTTCQRLQQAYHHPLAFGESALSHIVVSTALTSCLPLVPFVPLPDCDLSIGAALPTRVPSTGTAPPAHAPSTDAGFCSMLFNNKSCS